MSYIAMFSYRQGQFPAFIPLNRILHKQGPAEMDMVKFFRVRPPSVHKMLVKVDELGLIIRVPSVARSTRLAVSVEELLDLDPVERLPW